MPVALVVGCAECVWDDARRAYELFSPDAVVAVKDMIVHWPLRIDYGATLHPDRVPSYIRRREVEKRPNNFQIWAHKKQGTVVHSTTDWQGSSGLFGVKLALEQGFVVVCVGIPMVDKAGHIVRKIDWASCSMFLAGWKRHYTQMQHSVRSMSGWTKEFLGEPTQEWLDKHQAAPPDRVAVVKLMEKGNACPQIDPRERSLRRIGCGAA